MAAVRVHTAHGSSDERIAGWSINDDDDDGNVRRHTPYARAYAPKRSKINSTNAAQMDNALVCKRRLLAPQLRPRQTNWVRDREESCYCRWAVWQRPHVRMEHVKFSVKQPKCALEPRPIKIRRETFSRTEKVLQPRFHDLLNVLLSIR